MLAEITKPDLRIRLSVIIPTYNEEKRIKATVEAVASDLASLPYDSEIVIVDDGSRDGTKDVIRGCMDAFPRIRLIDGARNRGKGWAVRQGMMKAKGEFRVFVDADNSVGIGEWRKCEPLMQAGAHLVVGSRTANQAAVPVPQPLMRRFLGTLFRKLVRRLLDLPVGDTQVGFKVFSAQAANEVFSRVRTERWVFDVEVLAVARLLGYQILEAPVLWINDPRTRMSAMQMAGAALDLLEVAWRMKSLGHRPAHCPWPSETSVDIGCLAPGSSCSRPCCAIPGQQTMSREG